MLILIIILTINSLGIYYNKPEISRGSFICFNLSTKLHSELPKQQPKKISKGCHSQEKKEEDFKVVKQRKRLHQTSCETS
ncbi:uncharacterized protein LOC143236939 [Tachypleus tridentatus]|uniref:uncharacterized protein LOC143236939 n=1 Tax=Tachypleus tridentatus TaxID=6853 RepID=UPI003FD15133